MSVTDAIMNRMVRAINTADLEAAAKQVKLIKSRNPEATQDEIADILIKRKSWQAGSVGAVTSGAAIVPGLGSFTSLTFGIAADIGMTFKLQAELVLEMACLYEHELTEGEKRAVILAVTGISSGGHQVFTKAGQQIAKKATAELAQKSVTKAIPFIGVASNGGTNMVTTYFIGHRAKAYFSLGPEAMQDLGESARALTGLDERRLVGWLSETTTNSWQMMSNGFQKSKENVIYVGQSTGKLIVLGSNKVVSGVVGAGKWVGSGITAVTGSILSLFKRNKTADQIGDVENASDLLSQAELKDQEIIGVISATDEALDDEVSQEGLIRRFVHSLLWWQSSEEQTAIDGDQSIELILEEVADETSKPANKPSKPSFFDRLFRRSRSQEKRQAKKRPARKNGRLAKLFSRFRKQK
ncbi:MAG: hypothetical protein AAF490_04270 [Chloroflexota bacterium]